MKLLIEKDNSLEARVEYLKQLQNAHTAKEILNVMNGYFIIKTNKPKQTVKDMSHEWKGDKEKEWEAYQTNTD
jgi:hypothetical protein